MVVATHSLSHGPNVALCQERQQLVKPHERNPSAVEFVQECWGALVDALAPINVRDVYVDACLPCAVQREILQLARVATGHPAVLGEHLASALAGMCPCEGFDIHITEVGGGVGAQAGHCVPIGLRDQHSP